MNYPIDQQASRQSSLLLNEQLQELFDVVLDHLFERNLADSIE